MLTLPFAPFELLTPRQDGIVALVSTLSVSFFILRLHTFAEPVEEEESKYVRPNGFPEVLAAFAQDDHEAVARRIASAAPHLKHISLDIMGCRPRYWSISRGDAHTASAADSTVNVELNVKELEAHVGRELVRAEGLSCNDRSLGIQDIYLGPA